MEGKKGGQERELTLSLSSSILRSISLREKVENEEVSDSAECTLKWKERKLTKRSSTQSK